MKTFTAPDPQPERGDLFLASGISGCPDWQAEALTSIQGKDITVFNPRRQFYSSEDSAREQIRWEHQALHKSDTVLFWFPSETLCPIALYELGVFSQKKDIRLVVGTHPDYARRLDVIEQLGLERPEVTVHDSLDGLLEELLTVLP